MAGRPPRGTTRSSSGRDGGYGCGGEFGCGSSLSAEARANMCSDGASLTTCYLQRPRGCGGIGLRAGPRHRWAQALGGSSPLSRIKSGVLTCTLVGPSHRLWRFAPKDSEPDGSPGGRTFLCQPSATGSLARFRITHAMAMCRPELSARHADATRISSRSCHQSTYISSVFISVMAACPYMHVKSFDCE